MADVPVIDLSLLRQNSAAKSLVVNRIREACQKYGFFHVINHGIPDSVIEAALNVNAEFFELPMAAKMGIMSDAYFKAVRFGTVNIGGFSRDFLKLYVQPLRQVLANISPQL